MKEQRSGLIWKAAPRVRAQTVRRVYERLASCYDPKERFGNPREVLDDLIFIVLSNKTSPGSSRKAFDLLNSRLSDWSELLELTDSTLESWLRPTGLAKKRSAQIKGIVSRFLKDFGNGNVVEFMELPALEAERYLVSLPGVSEKVAKCVLMYTRGDAVLPVDSHVHRVACRLGWVDRKRADQCHVELESLVPAKYRFGFHVTFIQHGRAVCRPSQPKCMECCISKYCTIGKIE